MLNFAEPTPPPRASESPFQHGHGQPQNVLRTHCGWSFKVLDPHHPNPEMRDFVACTACHRPYLAIHASAPNFRCTSVHCGGTRFAPVVIPPPGPLDRDVRIPLRVKAGPHNAIDDAPLGISTGTLVFEQGGSLPLQVRNNSNETLHIPALSTAPWISWQWDDLSTSLSLAPGESRTATVTVGAFRPIEDDDTLQFPLDRSVMVVSSQIPELFHCMWFLLLILGISHWIASIFNPLLFAVSSTIWITSLLLFSPKILRGLLALTVGFGGGYGTLRRGLQRAAAFTRQGLSAWTIVMLVVLPTAAIISAACWGLYVGIQAVANPLQVPLHLAIVITTVNWYTSRRGYNPLVGAGRKIRRIFAGKKSK